MGKESFQALVARVNATAFLGPDEGPKVKRPKLSARVKRLLKLIEDMGFDPDLVSALRQGEAALINVDGAPYVVQPAADDAWLVTSVKPGEPVYRATSAACTCPDSKFRDATCKHVQAVRRFRG